MSSKKCVQAEFGQARASFAYLFKIVVDNELFLVGNEHPENWRYQPVGGGYQYLAPSHDIIKTYFAPQAAPSVHEIANAWRDLRNCISSARENYDFRMLVPAAKVSLLFDFFCSAEQTLESDSVEKRMSEACELNDLFTDLVYKTGQIALDKGWAQERGLEGAGQVMAYLKSANNLFAGMPELKCEREQLTDLSREFKEELLESGIIPKDQHVAFSTIEYNYLGYFREIFFDERFGCYSFFMSDVVELNLNAQQLAIFRELKQTPNNNYCFISESKLVEHILYRHEKESDVPFPPIADHSQKLLSANLQQTSFYKRTPERHFKVDL